MASIDNALTTLARAKSYLDISDSSKDLILTMLILSVTKYVEETHCKRKFKHQTYTQEVYSGNGSPRLYLKNKPLFAGSTVKLEHRTTWNNESSWEEIESETYFIDYEHAKLEKADGGVFDEGIQNYRVTYTAGFYLPSESQYQDGTNDEQDLPYDLELAVLDMVSDAYSERTSGGIQKEKVGQVEVTYMTEVAEDPKIKETLDKYARPVKYG